MRTGGKRKILVKSGGSKSQPLDTKPRHECSQRGPIATRANWRQKHRTAPPRWAKVPSEWGACYRELPRISIPRTSVNKGKIEKDRSLQKLRSFRLRALRRLTS